MTVMTATKTITVLYFAALRELAGRQEQLVETSALTSVELYNQLRHEHGFTWESDQLSVAINDAFSDWTEPLADGDRVAFLTPVAGG